VFEETGHPLHSQNKGKGHFFSTISLGIKQIFLIFLEALSDL